MYIIWKIPNINLLQFLFAHESFHVLWRPERCQLGQRASKRDMSSACCPPWRLRFCPRCSMAQCTWPDKGSSCWSNRTSRWTRIPSWRLSSRRHCNEGFVVYIQVIIDPLWYGSCTLSIWKFSWTKYYSTKLSKKILYTGFFVFIGVLLCLII